MAKKKNSTLAGQFLVAMPTMADPRFTRAVIYLCAHSADGAMGIIVNRLFENLGFTDLMKQLEIVTDPASRDIRVHFGGPVESGRGFVLHSTDYEGEGTLKVSDTVALTATVDVLKALAEGGGPQQCFLALGYAGWAPGQLDAEIQANGWLQAPADADVLFDAKLDDKWERALKIMGIHPAMLSSEAGHA